MSRRRKHLPYVPARLGRALMIDPTFGGAAQQLFFIGVHPLPGQSSSQSADANEPTPVNSN